MRPAFWVRGRDLLYRLRFWAAITGFNTLRGSLSYQITLVYAVIYIILWGFAILMLLAGGAAQMIRATGIDDPGTAAASLSTAGLLVWLLASFYSSSRRSPIIFSSSDASLLCQTPIDRRAVTIAWFAGSWPVSGAALWAAAVVLGFGVVEASPVGEVTFSHFLLYLSNGLRSLSIAIPIHMGLLAFVWAWGCIRLRWERQKWRLAWLPAGLAVLLLVSMALSGESTVLGRLVSSGWSGLLLPLLLPAQAAFGVQAWITGLTVSILWMVGGGICLWLACGEIQLSIAAAESRQVYEAALAFSSGDTQYIEKLKKREKLGAVHKPSWLLEHQNTPPGMRWGALVRKALLQGFRPIQFASAGSWLLLCLAGLGFVLGTDWGTRTWALAFWVVLFMTQSSRRLRSDLAMWKIMRQLPFKSGEVVFGELAFPWFAGTLTLWVAIAVGAFQDLHQTSLAMAFLAPFFAANVALAGAWDVFYHSKPDRLMAEQVPQPELPGALLGGGPVAAAAVLASGVIIFLPGTSGLLAGVLLILVSSYALWVAAATQYQRI